ncbi:nickel ABC transporter permease subunit NikB [Desulfosarcina ovata]|uniref:Nickel ABC transporter permease subunit NikB n=1 Tax=Desulfosarcina ovata subsp. ovata TaxID=2752305 RepID=A0A5K8AH56_9BACT|nr:nickel ABC transporter permease subunit NikB [Desulfosarcina ovata]BBO91816.1 nickel ABC transporter permease subunit NikB [Desulfosarcina ovata subsp. ovata]
MLRYITRRLLVLIPLLLAVSIIVFSILRLGENDPAMAYLRLSQIPPTDEALAQAREELGLDRPIVVQYLDWLGKAVRLDFGRSYVTGVPVTERLLYYLPNTLYLGGVSLAITLILSFPLGIGSVIYKDRWPDHLTRALAYVGVSTPSFWLGFLLVFVFSVKMGWLPPLGKGGLAHVIMPAFTLSLMSMCINTRLIRGSMLEQMHTRSVLFARIRGIPEKWVIGRHVLKNSMIPVVTAIGMHIGEMIGGAVVVEIIFAWPGVGRYAVSAIYNRDFPVMQCFILMMTVLFVLCNLGVDILYAWLDPRIRYEGGTTR